MTARKKKSVRPPEPFWNEFVSIWFSFCKEKFNEIPTFDGQKDKIFFNVSKQNNG